MEHDADCLSHKGQRCNCFPGQIDRDERKLKALESIAESLVKLANPLIMVEPAHAPGVGDPTKYGTPPVTRKTVELPR